MGRTVCAAVAGDPELELVAGVDPGAIGVEVEGITIAGQPDVLLEAGADVVVDFTRVEAARGNVLWAAEHGLHAVVGTTGFTPADLEAFGAAFTRSSCLFAPNFAIGAVLMMRFAELAAPWFETAEVIEMHHDEKRDAPSGTAMRTVERMAAASSDWAPDPTEHEVVPGARGGADPSGIHVHALRVRGAVAHQEVILGTTGQSLTIRHDSYDRVSFMPGVLLAVKRVEERPGLTIGLDDLLDL
jgi:4-hydroxy-tetrahydrodipicolinate reductase